MSPEDEDGEEALVEGGILCGSLVAKCAIGDPECKYWKTSDCPASTLAGVEVCEPRSIFSIFFSGGESRPVTRLWSSYDFCVTVELLPPEALVCCVKLERTDIREGFDSLARLSARRCNEPCFCRTRGRFRASPSVCRRRRALGSVVELGMELSRPLEVLLAFPSCI